MIDNLVYLSPKGPFKQIDAKNFLKVLGYLYYVVILKELTKSLIFINRGNINGRLYFNGGEVASFTFLDSILRLLPGVLGNEVSIEDESFSKFIEYPQYTKPQE